MIIIKKTLIFMFLGILAITGAFYFDYIYNEKSHSVNFYTVTNSDIQNIAEFRGIISTSGKINILTGVVPNYKAENLEIGDYTKIVYENKEYDGNVVDLKPIYNDLYETKISIMTDEELYGEARAKVSGKLLRNLKIVPYSCIFTDETGLDAVMIENLGYAVKRNVRLGKINNENGTEITDGIFIDEKLIVNPNSIKTGDRVN